MSKPPWATDLLAKTDLITPMSIRVAAALRLSDHMAAGAVTVDALAKAADVNPLALRRLLNHLVGAGLYRLAGDGEYAMTELGDQLRSDRPDSGRAWLAVDGPVGRGDLAFFRLLEAVTTGGSVYASMYGQDFWQDVEADPELTASFAARMAANMQWAIPALLEKADWTGVRRVVDVGGGSGAIVAAVVDHLPDAEGTLLDLAGPAETARADFAAAGLADRCTAVTGSFFDPLPAGADVYLLSNVLLNWDDEQATAILRRCAEAAAANGRVLVVEGLLDVQTNQTELDLRMLVYLNGRMRTSDELRRLGAAAGLELGTVVDLNADRSLSQFTVRR
ncbi:methyltransferase [Kitasatospora sp. NPDC001660]